MLKSDSRSSECLRFPAYSNTLSMGFFCPAGGALTWQANLSLSSWLASWEPARRQQAENLRRS